MNRGEIIQATFYYRVAKLRRMVKIALPLITVKQWNASDSCIENRSFTVPDSGMAIVDSLYRLLAHIPGKEYEKPGVIDGTEITILAGRKKIVCDNCLNDFVLETAGMDMGRQPVVLHRIKRAVGYIHTLADGYKKETPKQWKQIEVSLDREADTGENYSISIREPSAIVTGDTAETLKQ
jgi:hypothetical protein